MRLGMVIDLMACIGCRTCMVACKSHNSQPLGNWWNRVFTAGSSTHQVPVIGKNGNLQMEYLPVSCQMCENPPCQKVCPTGATYTDENGVVLINYERCIGCRYCSAACPYEVRQFNWEDPQKTKQQVGYKEGYEYGYPDEHRDKEGRLVYTPNRPKGVAEKCTFCVQYTSKGEQPACVQACPSKARIFGDLDDPKSEVSILLQNNHSYRLSEQMATSPKVFYLASSEKGEVNLNEEK